MRQPSLISVSFIYQPVSFLGVGFAGTSVHYLILAVMVSYWRIDPVVASTCGALAGAAVVHTLNYFLTFKSERTYVEALIRFIPAACAGFLINGLLLKIFLDLIGWPLPVSQLFASAGQFVFGFIVSRSLVY